MHDEDATTRGTEFEVTEVGGRRVFKARRLGTGNWLLVEGNGLSRRTINNEDFNKGYERVPQDDRKNG